MLALRHLNPTSSLTEVTDPLGRALIFRAGDLQARVLLLALADQTDDPNRHHVYAMASSTRTLLHAEKYLADRAAAIDAKRRGGTRRPRPWHNAVLLVADEAEADDRAADMTPEQRAHTEFVWESDAPKENRQ